MAERRLSKPAPSHNYLLAPALCGCVGCSRVILDLRCPATGAGVRCGNYRGHQGHHNALVATAFVIAEERVRLDA